MMLVDKETGKSYVEMEKVHRDKKEYASKAVGGTALGLSIGALGLQLLGGGLLRKNIPIYLAALLSVTVKLRLVFPALTKILFLKLPTLTISKVV